MGLILTPTTPEAPALPISDRIALIPGTGLGDSLLFLPLIYKLHSMGYPLLIFSSPLRSILAKRPPNTALHSEKKAPLDFLDTCAFSCSNQELLPPLRSCKQIFIQRDSPAETLQTTDLPIHLVGKRRFESLTQAHQIQSDVQSHLPFLFQEPSDKTQVNKKGAKHADVDLDADLKVDLHILALWMGLEGEPEDSTNPLVAIHPTSNHPSKNWPLAKFKHVATGLKKEGYRVVFCLGQDEKEQADALNGYDLWQGLELRELCQRLLRCDLLIGGDSGLGHLASLLGIPTLSLFQSPSHSRLWRPGWGNNQLILPLLPLPGFLRKSLWKACISYKQVLQAALRILR